MNVPKLRFKEFNEHWKIKELGEIFEITSGTTPSRGVEAFFKDGRHIWIKTTDLNNGLIKNTQEKVTDLALEKTSLKLLPEGSVLIAMYGGFNQIGRTGLLTQKAAINQALSAILPNTDLAHPYYLLSYLNHHVDRWKIFAASSRKDPNITKSDVKNFTVSFPALEEQTKIANFLTAIDEKITQLTQKYDLLTQYKKGVMQRIFSQKLRFKDDDGREFPEWEEKRLSDIAEKIQDGTHFSPELNESGQFLYITSKNVKNGYLDLSTALYVSEQSHNEIYKRCDVKQGDVLITKDGTIGQVCVNPLRKPFSLLSSVAFIRTKERFNNYFLYHLLLSSNGQKEIIKSIAGQALQRITLTKLNNFSYFFPILSEQTKIANFLTAIDEKITHTKTQLDAVKRYKKGLLQQLFV